MAFDRWRIGMDIALDVLRALSLSRERTQWRCHGWWQFPLPIGRDAQGALWSRRTAGQCRFLIGRRHGSCERLDSRVGCTV